MFTPAQYNALPTVDVAGKNAQHLDSTRQFLCNLISNHGLQQKFGVCLVHHHFPMNDNELPVFRQIEVAGVSPVIVMGPLPASDVSKYVPKNYVFHDGQLTPYEFMTGPGVDIGDYPTFEAEVVRTLVDGHATNTFGITALPNDEFELLGEFEIPKLRTTVTVPAEILPAEEKSDVISTYWNAQPTPTTLGYCRPGTGTGGSHGQVAGHCRRTTNGAHVWVNPLGPHGTPDEDPIARVKIQVEALIASDA